ncbi:centromere protein H [Numida meleagris]|uniref:centromere protein H n=1 Tax=Numida meleagris TaxID=8996 RepID=UPI000B3E1659|nr:centromere protein H [Numida meleagris]
MARRLPEPVGPRPADEIEPADDPNAKRDVLEHLCARTHLKQLVMEFSTACSRGEGCNNGVDVNFIESAKESLEEVGKVKAAFENKALVLQRIQLMDALRNRLKQNDSRTCLIMETMKDIMMLNWEILQAHRQACVIRENLNDLRRQRYFLKQAEGEKALRIFTTMRKKKEVVRKKMTEKLKFIHKNLQHERNVTVLIQNIFQNIIVGCRINWAKDPSLKAVFLQLEKDTSIQNLL